MALKSLSCNSLLSTDAFVMTVMPCAGNAIAIMDNELNTSMRKWHRLLRLLTRTAVFVFLFKIWVLYFYYSKGMQTGTVSGKKTQTFAIATVVLGRCLGICRLLVYKALKKNKVSMFYINSCVSISA